MSIFDVIGPVMIGPSSSHTAGVVRIGNITSKILGVIPKQAVITFYGSFAQTYVGHGSDKAIIAGLLGYSTDDIRIREVLEKSLNEGYDFTILKSNKKTRHPNTVQIEALDSSLEHTKIIAESLGGGSISIRKINDLKVELTGKLNTIVLNYVDKPGVVKDVSGILLKENVNIATMRVIRTNKGGDAIMLLEVDSLITESLKKEILTLPYIENCKFINVN